MFEVTVSGSFVARHALQARDGTTEPRHSHEWHVKVTYAGPRLDEQGILVDFRLVKERLDKLFASLTERDLAVVGALAGQNPSAEHVARVLSERLPATLPNAVRLACVEVEEEPGCFARYFPRRGIGNTE